MKNVFTTTISVISYYFTRTHSCNLLIENLLPKGRSTKSTDTYFKPAVNSTDVFKAKILQSEI